GDGTTLTGETAEHAYTWSGTGSRTFTVTLTVTDDSGDEAVSSQTVTVADEDATENQLPSAAFSYSPTSPGKAETIYFNASSSTDPDGTIVSWEWDFGDGVPGSGETVTHSYNWTTDGSKTFTVTLEVTDNDGGVSVTSQTVTVADEQDNQLPTASFSYSPTTPRKDEIVTFNGSLSTDTDGTITTWEWVFGDGAAATGETVTHTYTWTASGNQSYVVTLKVTDNDGGTDSISITIEVEE
ncbi:MAG: PKD domain-containing protein, partial [bacterium]|nr:PKD domain-containing protein [bacterium]